jgi:hypothetical protein
MAYYPNTPGKDHTNVVIPPKFHVKKLPMRRAYAGSYTFAHKGGMCGSQTAGNSLGVVPQAFNRHVVMK